MEHSPPPFFRRGPAPVVRLAFFVSLSLALAVLDARFRYADGLRGALALFVYPLQLAATVPVELAARVAEHFADQARLREENAALRARLLEASRAASQAESERAELAELRRLAGAAERLAVEATLAEILHHGRDPFARKVVIGRGARHGLKPGSPVVNEAGAVGQVTRVYAFASEVTLLTDKDQAIPVQVVRNGLRAVAFGGGASGMLELRFMAANAEIQAGDRLVTSGLDGVYPPGLPVATVVRVERDASYTFARILCEPAAPVDAGRYVLVLGGGARLAPGLEEIAGEEPERRATKKKSRRREPDAAR
jgi:rod shape-determining protein MreC